jgi:hypothetical protein
VNTKQDESLLEDAGDSIGLYSALLRVGGVTFDGDNLRKLLRRIYTEEVYRATILDLKDEDAQRVVDSIQLVSSGYCAREAPVKLINDLSPGSR